MECISLLHSCAAPAPPPLFSLAISKSLFRGSGFGSLHRRNGFLSLSPSIRLALRISCAVQEEEEEEEKKRFRKLDIGTIFKVAGAAATIAALALTLPVGRRDEPGKVAAEATTSEGAGKKGKGAKKVNVMPLEERLEWTKGLPVVQEKIAYTDLLNLRKEGKLKHIIKYPVSKLKSNPNIVLVVLDDDRVVRTVLPSSERDQRFWNAWDDLKLESSVVNAFTPPLPNPKVEGWGWSSPLFSSSQLSGTQETKKRQQAKQSTTKKEYTSAARGRLEQLEKARKDIERARLAKGAQLRRQQMLKANAERVGKAKALALKEQEEKRKREFEAKQARKEKLIQQVQASTAWDDFWYTASRNEGFRFILGLGFFWLFYQTVILGVKKRKKDYDDRLKIERAEEEERRKLKEWEDEMDTAQAVSTSKDWDKEGMSEDDKRRLEEAEMNPQVQMGLRFMRSGARVRRATGQRPPKYLDLEADVKFADVAGLGEIRKELEEVVDFFTYKEKFQRRGSKIPAGILLCGEPGTGKTLLAKAVAGEAGVNFFSISASQFVEIYVGVGASRVRALYQEARENAPAVVFIDELDAVGRQRGLIGGSGGQERDATLNQLLTCLDGFEGKGDVITIAATNRADILDTALVRPGRFDRKIYIPKPGAKGRAEILKVHARNKPMADDVDYDAVADVTDGMVGAQLANLLDVAALSVLRDRRTEITTDDLLEAARLEEGGHPDTRPRSKDLWHRVALNEASMAVAAINFVDFNNIQLLTITPRVGEEKGAVRIHLDHSKFELSSVSRQGMLDYITLQLAPRAADEIWYGRDQMSTIWADSYNHARKAARNFVFVGLSGKKDLYGLLSCWCEVDRAYEIDVEALKILDTCYDRAIQILERNRTLVDELVDRLIDQKVMRKEEFWELVEQHGSELEEVPPQAMDVRNAQLKLFQEQMILGKRSSRAQ